MAKKQVIKLTESDLHKIIEESVNKILSERTKSEQGLTDDEVSNRRDIKFANEFEPEYGDSIYGDEQERHRNMIHNARIMNHYQTQNHKTKMQEGKGWVKESVNKVLNEGQYSTSLIDMGNYVENYENAYNELQDKILRDTNQDSYLFGLFNKIDDLMYAILDGYRKYTSTEW